MHAWNVNDPEFILDKLVQLIDSIILLESSKDERDAINNAIICVSGLDYPNVMVSLLHTNVNPNVIKAVCAFGPEWESIKDKTIRVFPGYDILAKVLSRKVPKFVPDSRNDPECAQEEIETSKIVTQYVIPLYTSDMLIGTMQIHMYEMDARPELQCKLLDSIAALLSISISRFRNMLRNRETDIELLSVSKLALLNLISGTALHGIKDGIKKFKDVLTKMYSNNIYRENVLVNKALKTLIEAFNEMEKKTETFLGLVSTEEEKETVLAKRVIQDTLDYWYDYAFARNCKVKGHFPTEEIYLQIWPSGLREALSCLILNAIEAYASQIDVDLETDLIEGEKFAIIKVSDDGNGIAIDKQEQIFRLGYSTKIIKGQKKGTGIGLYMVQKLIKLMEGYFILESGGKAEGKAKTIFKIYIPCESLEEQK